MSKHHLVGARGTGAVLRRAAVAVVVAVLAFALVAPSPAAGAPVTANPVVPGDFPDPHVLRVGTTYYAYSTQVYLANVPVRRSVGGGAWVDAGDALPSLGRWAQWGYTWAPAVLARGPGYVLYYTARDAASRRQCIGRAVGGDPAGPFVDRWATPLVCQTGRGGSIDPAPFVDADGSAWLLWKSDDNALGRPSVIWSQRLTAAGDALAGTAVALLSSDQTWERGIVESPVLLQSGGRYYLLYSGAGWWDDSYAIGVATCASPQGPCRKTQGRPAVRSNGVAAGPGGQDVFTDDRGDLWVVHHGWTPGRIGYPGGARQLRLARATVDGAGPLISQPTADPHRPRWPMAGTVAGVAATPGGYWLATGAGEVLPFGDRPLLGSQRGARLQRPVVGMAATPSGRGYWLVAADGGIFTFGDARFLGSTGALRLQRPVVGMAATPSGRGYWLVAADGGIFTFGDARFVGSAGGERLVQPVVGMAATSSGQGYWLASGDGRVFPFGDAQLQRAGPASAPARPVAAIARTATGRGYWLVGRDGGVAPFGDATDLGGGYLDR